jgi:AcrR family transcriptional regulator
MTAMSSANRETHRDALLRAAKDLLRTNGYGNISARDLVAASGTNLGSIGYHFGSKEALLTEAIGQALEEWTARLAAEIEPDPAGSPGTSLARLWRAVLDDFERIRPYFVAFIEALPRGGRSPELAQRLAEHYDRQRDRVAALLAGALGDRSDPAEARRLATLAIALTDGLMLQRFVDRGRMPTSEELLALIGGRRG